MPLLVDCIISWKSFRPTAIFWFIFPFCWNIYILQLFQAEGYKMNRKCWCKRTQVWNFWLSILYILDLVLTYQILFTAIICRVELWVSRQILWKHNSLLCKQEFPWDNCAIVKSLTVKTRHTRRWGLKFFHFPMNTVMGVKW